MKHTPLHASHLAANAKMCAFAGYDMPIQYPTGVIVEHDWVRQNAGLFDVSHMGQAIIKGKGAAQLLSTLTPSSFLAAKQGKAKYTVLTNPQGGIIDDFIATRLSEDSFFLVINAACKDKDLAWIKSKLTADTTLEVLENRALIALQGPKAEGVLVELLNNPSLEDLPYMSLQEGALRDDTPIFVSRLGYTGEDGFELSIPNDKVATVWDALLDYPEVKPIGLAARDSLRLEMGYPLYGHDLTEETSPIEANLSWVVSKNHDRFIGSERILKEKVQGVLQKRVGIKLVDKGIAREGSPLYAKDGSAIGTLTSGGFSPSLKASIGQAYVQTAYAEPEKEVFVEVRGKKILAITQPLSFIEAKTKSAMAKK